MVFEAAALKASRGGETLKPAISSPYIVRRPDRSVGADCPSGAALGVAALRARAGRKRARLQFAALSLLSPLLISGEAKHQSHTVPVL